MKKFLFSLIFSQMMFLSSTAFADHTGLYFGGGGGLTYLNNYTDTEKDTQTNFGGKVFAGYTFTNGFGLEAVYLNYADTKYKYSSTTDLVYKLQATALALTFVTGGDPWEMVTAIGAAYVVADVTEKYNSWYASGTYFTHCDFATLYMKLGVGYQLNNHLKIILDYNLLGRDIAGNNYYITSASHFFALSLSYYI